jgi:hypothetical protein
VGCVVYVPGRSSSLGERARGGDEETMGSSRYIVQCVGMLVSASAPPIKPGAIEVFSEQCNIVSLAQTKTQACRQRPRHGAGVVNKEKGRDGVAGISQKVAPGIPPDAPSTLIRVWRLGQVAHYNTGFGRVQGGLAHTRPTLPKPQMTTRRTVGAEKVVLENDLRGPPGPSNISPAVPA